MNITTSLGNSREIVRFSATYYECPFCAVPVAWSDKCKNPICPTTFSPEREQEWMEKEQARVEEKERRERERSVRAEYETKYRNEQAEWEKLMVEIAKKEGYCLNCLFQGGRRVKHIRHRKGCTKEKK